MWARVGAHHLHEIATTSSCDPIPDPALRGAGPGGIVKKIIASLFAAVLMSVGLVAVSGATAPASAQCGYPTAARTTTTLEHDPVVST